MFFIWSLSYFLDDSAEQQNLHTFCSSSCIWFYIFSNFNSLTLSICPLTDTLSPFDFVLISAIEITAGLRCSWIRSSVMWLSFEVSIIFCEIKIENYFFIHEKLIWGFSLLYEYQQQDLFPKNIAWFFFKNLSTIY